MTSAGGTIAVVDDDLSVRRGLERLLRSRGFQVQTFASAVEFLTAPVTEDVDCLVLDVRMPGPSGFDLQDALRAADREIPIVFISGHGDVATVARAMSAGAVEFLAKPFDDKKLFEAVARALTHGRRARPDDR